VPVARLYHMGHVQHLLLSSHVGQPV
jgi:hypothetical protein